VISTRVRVGATFVIWANSAAIGALLPTISKRSSVIARRPWTSRSIARRSTALRATINRLDRALLDQVVGAGLGRAPHPTASRAPRS
jgi:hypothetical protein